MSARRMKWADLTPEHKASIVQMSAQRIPYRIITAQTGCSVKIIRLILDEAGICRSSMRRAKRKLPKRLHNQPNGVPSALYSRVFLVGFDALPAWTAPFQEAGRVYKGIQP